MVESAASIAEIRDYIADCKRTAELHLRQGFGSLETAVDVQLLIERAATSALCHRLEDELSGLRELSDRASRATCALALNEIAAALEHGERPPEEPWRWTDFEKVIARSRACGLDVTAAEQALIRAREVAAARARGYDSPEHEDDVRRGRSARALRTTDHASIMRYDVPAPDLTQAETRVPERPAVAPFSAPPRPVDDVHGASTEGGGHLTGFAAHVSPANDAPAEATAQPTAGPDISAAELELSPDEPIVDDSGEPGPSEAPNAEAERPRKTAPEAPELRLPRFPLPVDVSAGDIKRHFSEVEAAIPPRLTGAATAIALWKAIREAHDQGDLPIAGNWVDLVATLHHRRYLSHLPSDRASRAALVILAELSPLVRRLHHRRWVLGAED